MPLPIHIKKKVQAALRDIRQICEGVDSKSQFFPFGGEGYKSSVRHYLESSCEIAAGAVQPGCVADLVKIMGVLRLYEVPFAVKGGGHATNPGFSSTEGIQVYMARFNEIRIEKNVSVRLPGRSQPTTETIVHVGSGCLFDELYREVIPNGVNIVGGSSIGGVGVAGWILGGGFSLKTNQHGLGIDNVLGFEIVLPKGGSKRVTTESVGEDKDLFEAVKGGGSNFGIVTEFTLLTHRQAGIVYGGLLVYEEEDIDDVKEAVVKFGQQTDPKASIVAAFRYYNNPDGQDFRLTVQCFYDGQRPQPNPFADFLAIPHTAVKGGGDTVGMESIDVVPVMSREAPTTYSIAKVATNIVDFQDTRQTGESLQEVSYDSYDQKYSLVNGLLDQDGVDFSDLGFDLAGSGVPDRDYSVSGVEAPGGGPAVEAYTVSSRSIGSMPMSAPVPMSASMPMSANSMSDLVPSTGDRFKRAMSGIGENTRGRWGNVMVGTYTKEVVDEIERQAKKAAKHLMRRRGKMAVLDIWPFTKSMFDKSTPAAWPHKRGEPNGPILVYFIWEGVENDEFWIGQMNKALDAILTKVRKSRGGREDLPVYLNTTLSSRTSVHDIYRENLERLMKLRKRYDPELVMNRAGGFNIPHPEYMWS